ncbi:MAG: helicase-related protein, partial [Pseudomonadota bacterium]
DLVVVDEAHLIPRKAEALYGQLFAGLEQINPSVKVIGLTATPYRLDSGALIGGDGALFDGICYDIPIRMLVERGFLSPLVSKRPGTVVETGGLHTRGGEFIPRELDDLMNDEDLIESAVGEIVALGQDRKGWLAFCVSVGHSEAVRDTIRRHGYRAEMVTGQTPAGERDRLIATYKRGDIRAMVSVGVLTTGFDAPHTDLLALLRPTKSQGLYVQMLGRGMRTAAGKENCLVLDFAGNVPRFGPVDALKIPGVKRSFVREEGELEPGEEPTKECPHCHSIIGVREKVCPDCGFEFPDSLEARHEHTAGTDAVMALVAEKEPIWQPVADIAFARQHGRDGRPDSLRVKYLVGDKVVSDFMCFEHGGQARARAVNWFARHVGGTPPDNITEALEQCERWPRPVDVELERDGKYYRIKSMRFSRPQEDAA